MERRRHQKQKHKKKETTAEDIEQEMQTGRKERQRKGASYQATVTRLGEK